MVLGKLVDCEQVGGISENGKKIYSKKKSYKEYMDFGKKNILRRVHLGGMLTKKLRDQRIRDV
jgi:hypothetical protein